jgi:hypothetical protein
MAGGDDQMQSGVKQLFSALLNGNTRRIRAPAGRHVASALDKATLA